MKDYFYQRNLPHLQPPGGTFFITFRLYGSMPLPVINAIKLEYQNSLDKLEKEVIQEAKTNLGKQVLDIPSQFQSNDNPQLILSRKKRVAAKMYFKQFDEFLDNNLNEPHWMRNLEIAKLNYDNFHFYAKKYYDLWAFTIMSNHVHLLLTMNPESPVLWKVLRDLKKYSARKCNEILGRNGSFWEQESYDHLVRPDEFEKIKWYILNNPVKAGIVKRWEDWEWSYCHPDLLYR